MRATRLPAPIAIAAGGLVVGSFDAIFAIVFWTPRGGTPTRIFQSIAAGILGRASFSDGLASAILGVVLHYFIATSIVAFCWLLAGRLRFLAQHPFAGGAVYGLGVYAFMNLVVIPLSRSSRPRFLLSWIASSIVVHMFFIGIPASLFARTARRGSIDGELPVSL